MHLILLALVCVTLQEQLLHAGDLLTNATNTPAFAIHTVSEPLNPKLTASGTADWKQIKLNPAPIVSEADILNYDFATHTIRLTSEARARLPRPPVGGTPFVVVVNGQPVYSGVFVTSFSSMSFAVPSIVLDGRLTDPNRPANAMVIERAYPTGEFGSGPDPRSDSRIRTALAKRVSMAAEVDSATLSTALKKVLPKGWRMRTHPDAQPYGLERSYVFGSSFDFNGPTPVPPENPAKPGRTNEGFSLVIMPDEYLGDPLALSGGGPLSSGPPMQWLGRTARLKVFFGFAADTPSWPQWKEDVKRAIGIPVEPLSMGVASHSQPLTVTTNDVVFVARADGTKAVIQFTSLGTKQASYRWRYRSLQSESEFAGTGSVYERDPNKSHEAEALPLRDSTVRAGDMHLEWSPGGTNCGYLYFHPSRERITILPVSAFGEGLERSGSGK